MINLRFDLQPDSFDLFLLQFAPLRPNLTLTRLAL